MTDIEIIRAACVKANPEIEDEPIEIGSHVRVGRIYGRVRNIGDGSIYEGGKWVEFANGAGRFAIAVVHAYRPIRLADVLLALSEEYGTQDAEFKFNVWELLQRWNLRADDASQQSPETLAFLANLLKP